MCWPPTVCHSQYQTSKPHAPPEAPERHSTLPGASFGSEVLLLEAKEEEEGDGLAEEEQPLQRCVWHRRELQHVEEQADGGRERPELEVQP